MGRAPRPLRVYSRPAQGWEKQPPGSDLRLGGSPPRSLRSWSGRWLVARLLHKQTTMDGSGAADEAGVGDSAPTRHDRLLPSGPNTGDPRTIDALGRALGAHRPDIAQLRLSRPSATSRSLCTLARAPPPASARKMRAVARSFGGASSRRRRNGRSKCPNPPNPARGTLKPATRPSIDSPATRFPCCRFKSNCDGCGAVP